MRTIATLSFSLLLAAAFQASPMTTSKASAQTHDASTSSSASTAEGYFCPKCGKFHPAPGSGVTQASHASPASGRYASYRPVAAARGGIQNVLSMLNGQRARQGIGGLQYDPQLQAVAEQRAQKMASMGLKSHPPGSFAPGRYEGVGWSSSYSPSGVSACYTSDSRMRYAGAAMATGRDGVYFAVVYR